jgi:hypothetical protein
VSKTSGLNPNGQTITVKGSGFNTNKGIYVALCVKPAKGQLPSPCGGGVDTTGDSGASAWISSNPPRYAKNLVKPYGPGGTFTVTIKVSAAISDSMTCKGAGSTQCVVGTRNDHTRGSDRSQDVLVPVTFRS